MSLSLVKSRINENIQRMVNAPGLKLLILIQTLRRDNLIDLLLFLLRIEL